ncbi:MAG: ATP-binding protein, partial [Candidatus Omnitrophica bacterium]|nr:ATP-binding protein [Candidatus Omnitrophota bacterium]
MNNYRNYFGFKKEPFSNDIEEKDLLKLPCMLSVKERLSYVSNLGGVFVLTGDVGSGKSTAIRYAVSCFHPSSVKIAQVIATSGSVIDFYRQVAQSLNLDVKTASKPFLVKSIRMSILEIVLSKKQTLILTVDEA